MYAAGVGGGTRSQRRPGGDGSTFGAGGFYYDTNEDFSVKENMVTGGPGPGRMAVSASPERMTFPSAATGGPSMSLGNASGGSRQTSDLNVVTKRLTHAPPRTPSRRQPLHSDRHNTENQSQQSKRNSAFERALLDMVSGSKHQAEALTRMAARRGIKMDLPAKEAEALASDDYRRVIDNLNAIIKNNSLHPAAEERQSEAQAPSLLPIQDVFDPNPPGISDPYQPILHGRRQRSASQMGRNSSEYGARRVPGPAAGGGRHHESAATTHFDVIAPNDPPIARPSSRSAAPQRTIPVAKTSGSPGAGPEPVAGDGGACWRTFAGGPRPTTLANSLPGYASRRPAGVTNLVTSSTTRSPSDGTLSPGSARSNQSSVQSGRRSRLAVDFADPLADSDLSATATPAPAPGSIDRVASPTVRYHVGEAAGASDEQSGDGAPQGRGGAPGEVAEEKANEDHQVVLFRMLMGISMDAPRGATRGNSRTAVYTPSRSDEEFRWDIGGGMDDEDGGLTGFLAMSANQNTPVAEETATVVKRSHSRRKKAAAEAVHVG